MFGSGNIGGKGISLWALVGLAFKHAGEDIGEPNRFFCVESFDNETDDFLKLLKHYKVQSLLLVVSADDLWKHPISNLAKRIAKEVPSSSLAGKPAGLMVMGENNPQASQFAASILTQLKNAGMATLPPAFSEKEQIELAKNFSQALDSLAA